MTRSEKKTDVDFIDTHGTIKITIIIYQMTPKEDNRIDLNMMRELLRVHYPIVNYSGQTFGLNNITIHNKKINIGSIIKKHQF